MRGSSEGPDGAERGTDGEAPVPPEDQAAPAAPAIPGDRAPGRRRRLFSGPRRLLVGGLVAWLAIAVGLRAAVALPERCPPVDAAAAQRAAQLAVGWFADHQQADGRWTYRYEAATDRDLGGYEIVRHAGVLLALYQALGRGLTEAGPVADVGLAWALGHLVASGDGAALGEDGATLQVGASALLAAALVERRRVTGEHDHDGELAALGRFLVGVVEPSGAVPQVVDPRTGPSVGSYSRFFTGETFLALARLREALGPDPWEEPALRVGRYLAERRDEVEGWFPAIADHWAAYGLAEVARWPDGGAGRRAVDPEGTAALHLAGLFGVQVRYESQRTDRLPSRVTRGRQTLGAGLGTIGEGLANLAALADPSGAGGVGHGGSPALDGQRPVLVERASCVAGMLVERQVDPAEAAAMADPERAVGAWYQFGVTQMDDQQHALSALLLVGDLLATTR